MYIFNDIAVCDQIDITDHISYSKKVKKLKSKKVKKYSRAQPEIKKSTCNSSKA